MRITSVVYKIAAFLITHLLITPVKIFYSLILITNAYEMST